MKRKLKHCTYQINKIGTNQIRFYETRGCVYSIFIKQTKKDLQVIEELNENERTKKTLGKLIKVIYEDLINQQQ